MKFTVSPAGVVVAEALFAVPSYVSLKLPSVTVACALFGTVRVFVLPI